jgi:hypothetical protein
MFTGCWWDDDDDDNKINYVEKAIKSDIASTIDVQQGNKVLISIEKTENDIISVVATNGNIETTDNELKYYYDAPYTGNSDTITVNYKDAGGNNKSTSYNVNLKNKVTFMLYMSTENSLGSDEFNIDDLKEIAEAVMEKNNKNVNVVVYLDTVAEYDTVNGKQIENIAETGNGCYVYTGNQNDTIMVNRETIKGFKNTGYYGTGNTGAASELTGFINYSKNNLQSEKYILDIWSHGDGWGEDYYAKIKSRYIAVDEGDRDSLDMWEVESAIKNSEIPKIDIIYMDACLMGGIEVAYQLKDVSDYLVFSPELTPGPGGEYKGIINGINKSNFNSESMAVIIAEVNGNYYKDYRTYLSSTVKYKYSYVFSVVNQSKVVNLATAVQSVTDELLKSENNAVIEKIKNLNDRKTGSSSVLCYDESYNPYNDGKDAEIFDGANEESVYVDLGDFLIKVKEMLKTTSNSGNVESKIDGALSALNGYVVYKNYGDGIYWKSGSLWGTEIMKGTSGLSIYIDLVNMNGTRYSEYKTATSFGALTWYQNFLNELYGL